jgi:hypothetical protein
MNANVHNPKSTPYLVLNVGMLRYWPLAWPKGLAPLGGKCEPQTARSTYAWRCPLLARRRLAL